MDMRGNANNAKSIVLGSTKRNQGSHSISGIGMITSDLLIQLFRTIV
jgi:hypothetical protein